MIVKATLLKLIPHTEKDSLYEQDSYKYNDKKFSYWKGTYYSR